MIHSSFLVFLQEDIQICTIYHNELIPSNSILKPIYLISSKFYTGEILGERIKKHINYLKKPQLKNYNYNFNNITPVRKSLQRKIKKKPIKSENIDLLLKSPVL